MTTAPSVSQRLASFAADLEYSHIPSAVTDSAMLRVLDVLGVAIAAREERGPTLVRAMVTAWGGRQDSHLLGTESVRRVPAANAALANGTAAHALDFDDTHHAARVHPSAVVVPSALATGELTAASGRDVIAGIVAGIEIAVRIGMIAPGRVHERGLHATSLVGGIAAAASTGRTQRAEAKTITSAIGIAGSTASGLREAYLGTATDTKALHAGWAAHAGVTALDLAQRGFSAPASMMEGRFGFVRAFIEPDEHDIARATAELGDKWYTPETVFKLYPCGSLIHASIDAARTLRSRYDTDPDDIEAVTCIVPSGMVSTVVEPFKRRLAPLSGYDAKFSLPYAVAVALAHGNVTEHHFNDDALEDPRVRAILARTTYETDASMVFPAAYPGGVRVQMQDGTLHEVVVDHSPGSLERPAGMNAVVEKFRGNVEGHLTSAAADQVIDRTLTLADQVDVRALIKASVRGGI